MIMKEKLVRTACYLMTVKAKASKVRASEFRKPGKSYMSMEQLVLAHSA